MQYQKFDYIEMLKEISEDDKLVKSDYKKLLSQKEIQRIIAKKRKSSKKKHGG